MLHSVTFTTLLAAGLLTNGVVAAPAPRSDAFISWGSCESFGVDSVDPNLQCGYFEVPLDYYDNSAGKTRLTVAKYAATAPKKLGTIFLNPGAIRPSAIEVVAELGQQLNQGTVGSYDLVSWNPRVVGETIVEEARYFNDAEGDAESWEKRVMCNVNEPTFGIFCKQLYEVYSQVSPTEQRFELPAFDRQRNLEYLGTGSAILDLVSLGDAIVGQGRPINYWGVSYGTVLGLNLIRMFPERAGRVLLDGTTVEIAWVLDRISPADTEKTFPGPTDGCSQPGGPGCELGKTDADDVKVPVNYAQDVTPDPRRKGYGANIVPGIAEVSGELPPLNRRSPADPVGPGQQFP